MDLSAYYNEICKEPIIDRASEYDLFLEFQDPTTTEDRKQAIRTQIIKSNLRFCFKQAKYFSKNDPSLFEELILAANEGLIVGFEKYKPSAEIRFLSYAGWWVRQRILNVMSKMRIVALPIWRQQLSARILKFIEKKETWTLEDLKKEFPDVDEKDLIELSGTRFLTFYLTDMSPDLPDFEVNPISSTVEKQIDNARLASKIKELPPVQAEIINLMFGFHTGEEMSNSEICRTLGISKEQFKEHKNHALEYLKGVLVDHV